MSITVLLFEVNEYDQYGQYFITAWNAKPTIEMLEPYLKRFGNPLTERRINPVLNRWDSYAHFLIDTGGGRVQTEHEWATLITIEPGEEL